MQHILTQLQELDALYHEGSLDAYEQCVQAVDQMVQHSYPGFTIAYAEIYTAGADREAHGGMRHVLLPTYQMR